MSALFATGSILLGVGIVIGALGLGYYLFANQDESDNNDQVFNDPAREERNEGRARFGYIAAWTGGGLALAGLILMLVGRQGRTTHHHA